MGNLHQEERDDVFENTKFELRIDQVNKNADLSTFLQTNEHAISINLSTSTDDGRELKNRTDTADTEDASLSPPPKSSSANTRNKSKLLELIGSFDDNEYVIWHADSPMSASSRDENDDYRSREVLSFPTAGIDELFAPDDAVTENGCQHKQNKDQKTKLFGSRSNKNNKRNRNNGNNMTDMQKAVKGFFSSNILFPKVVKRPGAFSRNRTITAAASRRIFFLCKVPASIAEETTISDTQKS
mmetsp:Transcript_25311/g.47163  ORF Transcript_25311/g.47163 Transcript_25311/m.47163 type:complete len:242 (-) Transcript_25311:956-1681(-)